MDTKLTLMLNKSVIGRAKAYARKHNKSLSGMVENYFKILTSSPKLDNEESSTLIQSLKGSLKVPEGFDLQADRLRYLQERNK